MIYYDVIDNYSDGFARVCLNKKYGFIDINGNEICECKYDWVDNFYADYISGFVIVEIKHKCGFINIQGIEVVECKYDIKTAKKLLDKYIYNQKRIQKLKTII